ncbi:MAG: hypothetical protein ACTH1W_13525, partial [Advenella sp.]
MSVSFIADFFIIRKITLVMAIRKSNMQYANAVGIYCRLLQLLSVLNCLQLLQAQNLGFSQSQF